MLISTFIKRRILHLRHRWIGYLTSLLLIPLALYFTLQLSLGEWLNAGWLFPGILFIMALLAGMLPLWGDLQRSINSGFFDSIAASPNSGLAIVISMIISTAYTNCCGSNCFNNPDWQYTFYSTSHRNYYDGGFGRSIWIKSDHCLAFRC